MDADNNDINMYFAKSIDLFLVSFFIKIYGK